MKTDKNVVIRVAQALGNGGVIHHIATEQNMLGQSGVHTFCDDVISIVLNSNNEQDAYRNPCRFLYLLQILYHPNLINTYQEIIRYLSLYVLHVLWYYTYIKNAALITER